MSGAPTSGMSNLQLRIISAVILAVIVLGATWAGALVFQIVAVVIGAAIFYEWSRMISPAKVLPMQWAAALGLAVTFAALLAGFDAETVLIVFVIAVALVLAFSVATGAGKEIPLSVGYAGLSGVALAYLRGPDTAGLFTILYLFAVVWATDIAAYFVGRRLGGPKLAPSISPGKTWSGAYGGLAGGVIAGVLLVAAVGQGSLLKAGIIAIPLSIVSQMGDLFESSIKRRHGVKDSSNLIPGHGGVMDRVDGLVVAAIALYLIGAASGGLANPSAILFGP